MKTTLRKGEWRAGNCRIQWELSQSKEGPCFSASGGIGNPINPHTVGQCLEEIKERHPQNLPLSQIYKVWKRYHLNDMKAGTPDQEAAIESRKQTKRYDFSAACNHLESIGLLDDGGYKYGSKWLYSPIPQIILDKINQWPTS